MLVLKIFLRDVQLSNLKEILPDVFADLVFADVHGSAHGVLITYANLGPGFSNSDLSCKYVFMYIGKIYFRG